MNNSIIKSAKEARDASLILAGTDTKTRDDALLAIRDALDNNRDLLIEANKKDLERSESENLSKPLLKRLVFDDKKIDDVIAGIDSLLESEDKVGSVNFKKELAPGLILSQLATPLGVLGIVFESRPDAFVQIATLALKSANAVMLKGGREALETNRALYKLINEASTRAGVPEGWIHNLESRDQVEDLLSLDEYVSLIIPRGSNAFVRYILENTKIPVMGHADGICHTYIDSEADIDQAVEIAVDGKTQYPAVCNATETILVHKDVAGEVLPRLKSALVDTEIRGDERVLEIIDALPATEEDWGTEYLDKIVSIAVVDDINSAIDHINTYGSGHTDTIVTKDEANKELFRKNVDSACVLTNCSTRFSDGYRFGFGAEVGISTSKIHARGPVGIEGLMTYKYVLDGDGDIVADFAEGRRTFTHKDLD